MNALNASSNQPRNNLRVRWTLAGLFIASILIITLWLGLLPMAVHFGRTCVMDYIEFLKNRVW